MPNPYALARTDTTFDYSVAEASDFAASQPEYQDPNPSAENGYLDNPASAGAPLATSGHASIYQLPVSGPSYTRHQNDGSGTRVTLTPSAVEALSAQRIEAMPLYDRHNNQGDPNYFGEAGIEGTASKFLGEIGGEVLSATDFETQVKVSPGDLRWADNPRRFAPPVERPTTSPSDFKFSRPFDQMNRPYPDMITGSARHLTGEHFSMADHRREFDILGMVPARSTRNTYRLEPEPWDENVVDQPAAYSQANIRIESVDIPSANRSYRLM